MQLSLESVVAGFTVNILDLGSHPRQTDKNPPTADSSATMYNATMGLRSPTELRPDPDPKEIQR